MSKQAEYHWDACPRCDGTGKIKGPKVVKMSDRDRARWEEVEKKYNFLLVGLGLGIFVSIVAIVLFILSSNRVLAIPIFVILSAVIITILYRRLGKPYWISRKETLRRYGVEEKEWYIIENDD